MLPIVNYHAHFYYDAVDVDSARALCESMRDALGVSMGYMHVRPVGPHPRGSCQLTVPREKVAAALEWLMRHRGEFTVFMHGNSGDDWADHTAHVIWLGESEQLDLSEFQRP